jgi:mono/diheme cytochrome c family protein
LETVNGSSQGAVFHFSQGLRHMLHRFVFSADGSLWAGGIARGADQEFIHRVSGLTRIQFTGKPVFEPLAARLHSNGIEIEFTQPLAEGEGWDPAAYLAHQWGYQATQTYGGQKVRPRRVEILSASVSAERRKAFLELAELTPEEVLHIRMTPSLQSESKQKLWAGEFWYTINHIPANKPGRVLPKPGGLDSAAQPYFTYTAGNEGKTLFTNFCAACHSLDDTKLAGPALGGIPGSKRLVRNPVTGSTEQVEATAEYLRQSILEPNALIVDGYPENLMPPIGAILAPKQIDALIDYIIQSTQKKK